MNHVLLTATLLIAVGRCDSTERELVLVQAVWRHGDRSAYFGIPSEGAASVSRWPQGLGQLTAKGMGQQQDLGATLSRLHPHLLRPSTNFHQQSVYVRSTDFNRTLMSAEANMAGMWAGVRGVSIPDGSLWPGNYLPVPIHTVDRWRDRTLRTDLPCPAVEALDYQRTGAFAAFVRRQGPFLRWLRAKTAWGQDCSDAHVFTRTFDTLFCDAHGFATPAWANASVYEGLRSGSAFIYRQFYLARLVARLRGGPLLGEVLGRARAKAACLAPDASNSSHCAWLRGLKLYAYSGHDSTVAALLGTVNGTGLMADGIPGYAGCVLFRLWREPDRTFSLQVLYKDSHLSKSFEPVPVDGCDGEFCSLSQFEARSVPFLPTDWASECGLPPQGVAYRKTAVVLGVLAALLLLVMIVLSGVVFRLMRGSSLPSNSPSHPSSMTKAP